MSHYIKQEDIGKEWKRANRFLMPKTLRRLAYDFTMRHIVFRWQTWWNKSREFPYNKHLAELYGPTFHDTLVNQYDIEISKVVGRVQWAPNGGEYDSPFLKKERDKFIKKVEAKIVNFHPESSQIDFLKNYMRDWFDPKRGGQLLDAKHRLGLIDQLWATLSHVEGLGFVQKFFYSKDGKGMPDLKTLVHLSGMQVNAFRSMLAKNGGSMAEFYEVQALFWYADKAKEDLWDNGKGRYWGFRNPNDFEKGTGKPDSLSEVYRFAMRGGYNDKGIEVVPGAADRFGCGEFANQNRALLKSLLEDPRANIRKTLQENYIGKFDVSAEEEKNAFTEELFKRILSCDAKKDWKKEVPDCGLSKGFFRELSTVSREEMYGIIAKMDKTPDEKKALRKKADEICRQIRELDVRESQKSQYLESVRNPLTNANKVQLNLLIYGQNNPISKDTDEAIQQALMYYGLGLKPGEYAQHICFDKKLTVRQKLDQLGIDYDEVSHFAQRVCKHRQSGTCVDEQMGDLIKQGLGEANRGYSPRIYQSR